MNEKKLIDRLQHNIHINSNTNVSSRTDEWLEYIKKSKELIDNYHSSDNGSYNNNKTSYEMVNHPQHYNNYDVEVVDMMEKIWGTKATMEWCKMTAYKYRMRMGTKPGKNDSPEAMKNKLLEDFNKEQWYLKKANELKSKLFDESIDINQ